MKNKRGLSDVVTIVLIILLALAAVGIIWAFIKPTIENTGSGIDLSAQCFNTEVKPTRCVYNYTDKYANIQLAKGEANKVILVLEFADGTTEVKEAPAPNLLGTKTIDLTDLTKAPIKASAAAVISDDKGNEKTCDVSPTTVQCTA